jgi:5'-nucleotidase
VRILLTNDDGIDGPGLHALARTLKTCGHEIVIVAPNRDYSGYGAALGPLHVTGQVLFEDREIEDLLGVEAYAVDGPPALCAFSVALGGFGGKPDLLVSGINAGANLGRAVLHSGTVGAALTACQFGVPAMAISLASRPDEELFWDTAAVCAASLVHSVHATGTDGVLNVNVPNRRPYAVRGMKAASLAVGGVVQSSMAEVQPGALEVTYGKTDPVPGTDIALLLEGWITLSLIEVARDVRGDAIDSLVKRLTNEELAG